MQNRDQIVQLNAVMTVYETIANKNPTKLRLRIPAKEIWRYFVEMARYENNHRLHNYFDTQLLNLPHHRALLDGSLHDIAGTQFVTQKWDKFNKLFRLNDKTAKAIRVADIHRYNKGWFLFELSEPGYLHALYRAFDHIFERNAELTFAHIQQIHRTATTKVRNTNYDRTEEGVQSIPGQVRDAQAIAFPLSKANCSIAGIYQILIDAHPYSGFRLKQTIISRETIDALDDTQESDLPYLAHLASDLPLLFEYLSKKRSLEILTDLLYAEAINENLYFQSEFVVAENPTDEIETMVVSLVDQFNQQMRTKTRMFDKLYSIVNFIQTLEQVHPFADGNCRTFCMILLNQLLVTHGMPISLTHDANAFDSFSCRELVDAVIQGMQNTFLLINGQLAFGTSTNDLLALADESNTIGANSRYFHQAVAIEERTRRRLKPYLEKRALGEDATEQPARRPRR